MEQVEIILEDLEYGFTNVQFAKFITYWNEYSKHSDDTMAKVNQIAEDLDFPVDNTFLVILHLKRKGLI